MKRTSLLKYLYWPFLTARAKFISHMLEPFVVSGSAVLDIGAGNMLISKNLNKTRKTNVHGIDIIDMNLTNLPHKIFDGSNIPYENKCFDYALFIGVLHHLENQEQLLNEASRVTKSKIIIFEDIYKDPLGKLWVKIRDILGNIPEEPNMNFALNFRSDAEWENLFEKLGLKIEHKKITFNPIRLTFHALYILAV